MAKKKERIENLEKDLEALKKEVKNQSIRAKRELTFLRREVIRLGGNRYRPARPSGSYKTYGRQPF